MTSSSAPDINTFKHKIRSAQKTDIESLVSLINSAYRGESSQKGWTTEAHLLDGQRIDPDMLQEIISEPNSVLLLLDEGVQGLKACVHLKKLSDHQSYLGLLTVNPEEQNSGYGKILLHHAEQWTVQNWKTQSITMNVIDTRSELIAWYQRRGYTLTGQTSSFPVNHRFGIPKVDKIIFTELVKTINKQ